MNAQELIERIKAAIDGAIVLAECWYNGNAPVSNRDNNDNWCNLMDAKQHIVALESMLTVKGEPGEAIKILSNFFTPAGNQNRYSVRQYRECIKLLESTIADLTEQVRVAGIQDRGAREAVRILQEQHEKDNAEILTMKNLSMPHKKPRSMRRRRNNVWNNSINRDSYSLTLACRKGGKVMIERLYTPCPCTWDEQPGWEFVESDSDYWRPCTDCNGTLKIKESDADFIARLQSIIEQQEKSIAAYKRLAWKRRRY